MTKRELEDVLCRIVDECSHRECVPEPCPVCLAEIALFGQSDGYHANTASTTRDFGALLDSDLLGGGDGQQEQGSASPSGLAPDGDNGP